MDPWIHDPRIPAPLFQDEEAEDESESEFIEDFDESDLEDIEDYEMEMELETSGSSKKKIQVSQWHYLIPTLRLFEFWQHFKF